MIPSFMITNNNCRTEATHALQKHSHANKKMSALKAEPLPLLAYFVSKGKLLPWVTILLYRYLPKSGTHFLFILNRPCSRQQL